MPATGNQFGLTESLAVTQPLEMFASASPTARECDEICPAGMSTDTHFLPDSPSAKVRLLDFGLAPEWRAGRIEEASALLVSEGGRHRGPADRQGPQADQEQE